MKGFIVLALSILMIFTGCDNFRSRHLGGTSEVEIPADRKFVNATWKENDLWIVTRVRRTNDIFETYYFEEKSSIGMLSGTVVFNENKPQLRISYDSSRTTSFTISK